jgi:hypothetical protein
LLLLPLQSWPPTTSLALLLLLLLLLLQLLLLPWVICQPPAAAWGCVLPTPAAPETEGPGQQLLCRQRSLLVWPGPGAAALQG